MAAGKAEVLMGARRRFTNEEQDTFVELASKIGLSPAVAQLGYPALPTAHAWMTKRGVAAPMSPLARAAGAMKHFYAANEKLTALQAVLDKAYDLLMNGEPDFESETVVADPVTGELVVEYQRRPVNASQLRSLAMTITTTIEKMNTLQGEVTQRIELVDPTDMALRKLIEEQNQRNAALAEQVRTVVPA